MKANKNRGGFMIYYKYMTDEHGKRLPFVRIKKVELTTFKGVKHGILEFNCAKENIPYNTKSDIMGLYGQNGSGKSSLVDALNIIKELMYGFKLDDDCVRFIDVETGSSIITIVFDFQYVDGRQAEVEYSAKLTTMHRPEADRSPDSIDDQSEYYVGVSEEKIISHIYTDGSIKRRHTIFDTADNVLCGDTIAKELFGKNYVAVKDELSYLKRKSYEDGRSFIFSSGLAKIIGEKTDNSAYKEILVELNYYASRFLHVIESRSSGIVQLRLGIPLFLPTVNMPLVLIENDPIPARFEKSIKDAFDQINIVIGTIIPDLQLDVEFSPMTAPNGEAGICTTIYSVRGSKRFPFAYESDGIIKIVCILADYIVAFNQGSTTLVVDEFDSGVFEYLLGELLQIFEESGKGQFIFTSHNLRPLEVIDKKFIRFTTYDPNNRYYRLSNVGETNNLRDLYLRKVQLGNDDVEIYRRTKSFKIVKALRSASGRFADGQ